MTHKHIRRFQVNVDFLDDSDIIRIRHQYESLLTDKMRGKGYARVLDIDTAFSIEFTGETWKFLMTLHGVYVGKRKAEQCDGWSQGKLIPRSTRQHTLSR
jgi:glucose-6-phosphate 1-dehydrogenase